MEFEQYLYDEFIAEANEHLLTIEEDFLELERNSQSPDPDLVDKVFRAIHSVKGGSAFLGLNKINQLSHAMENLLSMMREDQIKPESVYIEALLVGVDLLSSMVQDPLNSNDTDIEAIRERLVALGKGELPAAKKAAPAAPAPEPPAAEPPASSTVLADLPDSMLDLAGIDFPTLLTQYDYIYLLRCDLAQYPAPDTFIKDLQDSGAIVDATIAPVASDLKRGVPSGPLAFEAVYATLFDPDMVEVVTGLGSDDIRLLAELKQAQAEPEAEAAAPADEDAPAAPETEPAAPAQAAPAPPLAPKTAAPPAPQADAPKSLPASVDHKGSTIRINVGILDKLMTLAGELVLVRNQQLMTASSRSDPAARDIVQRLDIVTTELQSTIMRTRMQPIGNVLGKLPRIVRDLSNKLGKQISIDIVGNEVELDKTILESLNDPLTHIIRNCCDHGVEMPKAREAKGKDPQGRVLVRAYHEGGQINIEIKDDGAGIDPEKIKAKVLERGLRTESDLNAMSPKDILSLILLPGFSTAEKVSDISGRGVGMDVVKHAIEELGGSVELDSWVNHGTSIHLRLPLTLAIIPCLIVKVGKDRYAIPQVNLEELVCLYDDEVYNRIEVAGNQEVYRLRDRLLPMVRLIEVLQRPEPFSREIKGSISEKYRQENMALLERYKIARDQENHEIDAPFGQDAEGGAVMAAAVHDRNLLHRTLNFAVVKVGPNRFGLIVDEVLGTEEIVVKPMHGALKHIKIYSGATVMGDGSVALILDIEGTAKHAGVSLEQLGDELSAPSPSGTSFLDTQSILLFRSGPTEQFAMALPLIRRIERIETKRVEPIGSKEFITVDGVSTLVLRLDKYLSVSPCKAEEDMFLILPKFIRRPFGILMSHIIDIVETPIHLNTESYMEDGLLGTDIIEGHLTLFPDIYRLIEKAEPKWFEERRTLLPPPERKRILVVEDSAFLRQMVRKYLEADDYSVVDAENGQAALEILNTSEFDCIVSDIEMPVMNGYDFIKNVRIGRRQPNIPAMALTSLSTEADRMRAIQSGFDEYQIKIDREQFLMQVAKLIHTKHGAMTGGKHVG
ncbi:MAG: chemotaxis protein CheW [Desulfovibrionaceae bacterium]